MFFKKRITVPQYCATRLELMLSPWQDDMWMDLKRSSTDAALRKAQDQMFLDNMHAAHLQLMGVALGRTYHNFNMAIEASQCVTSLLKTRGLSRLESIKETYNTAFGSSPADGVLAMANLVSARVANGDLAPATITE